MRDHVELRFDYQAPHVTSRLQLEPYRLVSWQRRWFVVARDARTDTWAPYRLDWMHLRTPGGRRFTPQPLPGEDYTSFVLREVAFSGWLIHTRIAVDAPAEEVLARINPTVGVVESVDAEHCVLVTGGDSVEIIAVYIGMLGLDFHVTEPAELVEAVAQVGERYRRGRAQRLLELQLPAHDPVADQLVDADHVVVGLGVPGVDRRRAAAGPRAATGSCPP